MQCCLHFQVTQTVTTIGSENSLCINANGCYGVLYIATNQKITCATCRFGRSNCMHVQHLSKAITTLSLDLPDALKQFSTQLLHTIKIKPPMKQYPDLSCVSQKVIPFDLPTQLSAVFHMSLQERYSISNSVAQLVPQSLSTACMKCNEINWSDPYLEQSAVIITNIQLLKAQGKSFHNMWCDCYLQCK